MFPTDISNLLERLDQEHLFPHFETLSPLQKRRLFLDLSSLSPKLLRAQKNAVLFEREKPTYSLFTDYHDFRNASLTIKGRQICSEGRVGTIIVAGGQGTRLGFSGPKGSFPLSLVKNKSLFQIFAERVFAASHLFGASLPLAIMTSPVNHEATKVFFEEHDNFSLKAGQVKFFKQGLWPLLSDDGKVFLSNPDQLAKGPNGNGGIFHYFREQGLVEEWKRQGIDYVTIANVDNPLVDLFDLELLGLLDESGSEAALLSVKREDPGEKVGVPVLSSEGVCIAEYSELDEEVRDARDGDGNLLHRGANIGFYVFRLDFIDRLGQTPLENFPLHVARKPCSSYEEGQIETRQANKMELFIFDGLRLAERVPALLRPRMSCFAPLKNAKGDHSPEAVKKALWSRDQELFEKITGISVAPDLVFELGQEFHYPDQALRSHWEGRPLTRGGYIEGVFE